jgi:dihydroorotase
MPYDLLIRGGTVVDPSQGLDDLRDVALSGGKVAAVEVAIPESEAADTLDATGLIVLPGLLDLHVHAFWGVSHYGVEPDVSNLARGVTTALDAGSAGSDTFAAFRRYVLDRCDTRLYCLLNISSMGMISPTIGELEDLRWADVQKAVRVGSENRDRVLGIKARLSRAQAGENDVEALKRGLDAAEGLGGILMIHIGDSKTPLEDLVEMLRPGDVVTHSFTGMPNGVLDNTGKVLPGVLEAQRRGVVFDIGHGAGSFSFDVAEKALAQGFFPGNISSDIHSYNIEGPVFDQLTVLSKLMWLGMPLGEVVRLSTESTARTLGMGGSLGTLNVGAEGDVTLTRLDEGHFTLTDSMERSVTASRKLSHVTTVKGGRVYRSWAG